MAAPFLKFLSVFANNEGYGWTEVHYKQAGSESPNLVTALNNFVLGVQAARQPLLGQDSSIVGARVSYPSAGEVRSFGRRQKFPGTAGEGSSGPSTSLACVLVNADGSRKKIVHVRGFWDKLEHEESYHPELAPGWDDRLTAWKTALIQGGYGWLTKNAATSASGDVNGYVVNANNTVSFTLAGDLMPLATVGTRQMVAFSKFHNSKSILNRTLFVDVVDQAHLTTVNRVGADPVSTKGRFNFRATTFVAYNELGSVSLGQRAQGKPLNRRPGRAKAKPLI